MDTSEQIHYKDMIIYCLDNTYILEYLDTDVDKQFRYLFDKLEDAYKYRDYICDLLTY